jgi:signal transduction histidine kinase
VIRRVLGRDTLRRRIALTIFAALLASLALNALFVQLAGNWARPPIERTGLLEQIAVTTRMIETAPAELREQLAQAASSSALQVTWQARRAGLALPGAGILLDSATDPDLRALYGATRHMEVFNPDDWPAGSPDAHYMALLRLADGSWLAFVPPERSWGLSVEARIAVVLGLGLIATLLVAWLATRQLANPLQRFAGAVRRFGGDLQAPPIAIEGPEEIRQAIIAFNIMQAQIQHFIRERTHMLAAISHDLRAPLTRLRLRSEFMEDKEHQAKLVRDVEEMQTMINAALAFFREGTQVEQRTAYDLSELLQTLVDDYRDQGIAVGFYGPAHLVHDGRPLATKRVIVNLLENAVKYAKAPRIALSRGEHRIVIEVSDEGPGIPEEALQRVFDPFFRLEGSRNRDTGGVGLGLSAARASIREQGGELTLRNRAGGGLLARAELPDER